MKVADAAKRNLIGNLPLQQLNDRNLEDTKEGREYLSAFSSFVARSTAGTNAVDSILAIKKSSDVSVNSKRGKYRLRTWFYSRSKSGVD